MADPVTTPEPVPLHPEYFGSSPEAPTQDRSQLPIDEQYFGEGARAIGEQNPVIQTIDKLKDIPGRRSEVPTNQQVADLDRRTPPPLPMVPSSSIAPHNPNPPGGGPYTVKPGERLS